VTGVIRRILAACTAVGFSVAMVPLPAAAAPVIAKRTPIQHFLYLMQGDRSFDNYFGSYPGADGFPPGTCQHRDLANPRRGCVVPFPLAGTAPQPLAAGRNVIKAQLDGDRMDGFVAAFEKQGRDGAPAMGYYDARDIPFHWETARENLLFDRFFAAAPYGIRLNRSYWVAGAPPPGRSEKVPKTGFAAPATIFDRLQQAGVSWKFYVQDYDPQGTFRAEAGPTPVSQTARVPLLNYARFVDDPVLRAHIVDLDQYYEDLEKGTLPAVAYIASSGANERTARSIPAGQQLIRNLVTQLMVSRYWQSSALLWSYDGAGGWYDHVRPPTVAGQRLGLRVPAILVSPYARRGAVNSTTMDSTSALRFIEENWGLAPLAARDAAAASLGTAFDFGSPPRPAKIPAGGPITPVPPSADSALIYGFYLGAGGLATALVLAAALPWRRRRPATNPGKAVVTR
jgi:phospholipase C